MRISIHALRKESDTVAPFSTICDTISIHALRKESDGGSGFTVNGQTISIHALRKESDAVYAIKLTLNSNFNPRSP